MNNIVIASVKPKAGKTTVALGIAKKMGGKIGYMKPLGDNQIYKKKRLVDYDAALFRETFGIEDEVDELTLGFHHSKVLHSFPGVKKELKERFERLSSGKDFFVIEGSENLVRGKSIGLDSLSVASHLDADILLVLSGDIYDMEDSLSFAVKAAKNEGVNIAGVVMDRVKDDSGKAAEEIEATGIPLIGKLPYMKELDVMRAGYIADKLFARVVAGRGGLENHVENILIAALSVPEMLRHPDFKKENKLIITGGDRSDVITASIKDERTSCVILTNNIVPPSNILAMADRSNLPLLSIRADTYTAAKKVEGIESIILPDEKEKIESIEKASGELDIAPLMN
ncbi:MAG TPA: hypothetical protein ENL18_00235 [Thermoplasmatales archaeon]|nr:hypothetical protein [Thermoplasmatales archaeon]